MKSAVTFLASSLAQDAGNVFFHHFEARFHSERVEIAPDQAGGRGRGFHKVNLGRSPAQSFDPDRARAGAKVEPDLALEDGRIPGGQHIEQGFAQPVGGGTQVHPGERAQRAAAKFPGDHSHDPLSQCCPA